MKVILTLCLAVLAISFSHAQKCEEVADPITGERSVTYKYDYTYFGVLMPDYSFRYDVKKGVATLTKDFIFNKLMESKAPAGSEVYFKLENGTIIKLITMKDALPQISMGPRTTYNFVFELTKSQLVAMSQSSVVLIRIPKITEEGFTDLDGKNAILKKIEKPLRKGAKCISESLP